MIDRVEHRRQLQEVLAILAGLSEGAKQAFLETPKGSLGSRTPLEALEHGDVEAVKRTAQAFVDQ